MVVVIQTIVCPYYIQIIFLKYLVSLLVRPVCQFLRTCYAQILALAVNQTSLLVFLRNHRLTGQFD